MESALCIRGDPYETSEAVFGVKDSLIVDLVPASKELAEKFGVQEGSMVLMYDFMLVTAQESDRLRDENSLRALGKLGRKVKLLNHLPVPDVD